MADKIVKINKQKNLKTENEHDNTRSSILPGEIDQVDAFTFKSVTFVVDSRKTKQDTQSISNQFYVLYLIEKMHEYHEELCDSQSTLFVSVYDINSNEITDSGKPSVSYFLYFVYFSLVHGCYFIHVKINIGSAHTPIGIVVEAHCAVVRLLF